jgi:hypothetical protein
MGRYELKGVGLPIGDQEISMVRMFDGSAECGGICELLHRAGAESTDYYMAEGPFRHHPDDMDQSHHAKIDEYRFGTGHQYPPLYRIKIVIDVEPLNEKETEAAWLAHRDKEPIGRIDEE